MKNDEQYTPQAFAERMRKLTERDDWDERHVAGDNLMMEFLRHFGYGEGCDIFNEMEKWYQ